MVEQNLMEKLETFGINAKKLLLGGGTLSDGGDFCPGQLGGWWGYSLGLGRKAEGSKGDGDKDALKSVESERHKQEREIPNFHQLREFLKHQVSCKIEEKALLSSEEEQEDDDLIRAYASPGPLPVPPSQSKGSCGKNAVKSDADGTEGSEIEDTDGSLKPAGASIKTPTEKVEKMFSHRKNVNKPVGGINVPEMFIKKEELQELKCADVEDEDWDISSLEEEISVSNYNTNVLSTFNTQALS
ncbi:hypothetical protein P7K49_000264 [Saguinus oedipus]|uniref:Cilium assembly protein DZIP1 domain-containing protein n=1 Tax=Saguinus oedipus TaxID=9490 RepID=A0ABQ9WB70_SAGOE|nr:hypothetical protein P7K49_000264 [Saguinus oedipus]